MASVGVTGRPVGCTSNHSKFLQKSNIKNDSFLPFGSHSLCSQILLCLVPRPIICQNLIGDLIGLIKTRLQTSGIFTPVSKIPTEIAILGKDFFLKSLTSRVKARARRSEIIIGFKNQLARDKEDGHATGAGGQKKRPIIPGGNKKFSRAVTEPIEKDWAKDIEDIIKKKF